jgi:hypothetical protein
VALAGTFMLLALASFAGCGRRGQWAIIAMVWTSSTVLVHIWDGKVDLFGAAAGIAAYYWVIYATRQSVVTAGQLQLRDLCLAGLFTALAVLAKLTLLVSMMPGLFLLFAWRTMGPAQGSQIPVLALPRAFFGMALTGATVLWPQVLKNALMFGEPFAPVLFLSSARPEGLDAAVLTMADTRYILGIYPLALVFGRFNGMGWTLSPLILALFPLAFLLPRSQSLLRSTLFQLSLAAVIGIVFWHVFRPANFAPRYLLPTLVLFTLAPACAVDFLSRWSERPRLLGPVVMGCLLLSTLVQAYDMIINDNLHDVVLNEWHGRPNLPINPTFFRAYETVNNDAPPGARILIGMHDSYWLRVDLMQTFTSPHQVKLLPPDLSPADCWYWVASQNHQYILVEGNCYPGQRLCARLGILPDGSIKDLPAGMHVEKIFHVEKCMVFRLRPQ